MSADKQMHPVPGSGGNDADRRDFAGARPAPRTFAEGYSLSLQTERRSFGFVRYLGWITLCLLVILSIALSSYFGNAARNSLLGKQQEFAELLSDYLNSQIYRRFTMPTVSFFGGITLSRPEQYKALEQVILSITQGLQVEELRIYAHDNTVTYSTVAGEPGTVRISPSAQKAAESGTPIFDIDTKYSFLEAFFRFPLKPGSFKLRTTTPLRPENRLGSSEAEGPVMGVLEFTQDISADVESAIRFQQLILVVTTFCSSILLCLLLFFVRRAEWALADRMEKENTLVRELHQNEKLAGMGRTVAGIAHEIRNPLGIISSSAELLVKRAKDKGDADSRILQAMYDETKRLSRTVNDFLDYARPRPPQMEPVDVASVIARVMTFLEQDTAGRNIGIVRTGFLDAPLMVKGDTDLLYRAFYNIMSNAFQAMGTEGTLMVDLARRATPEPEVVITFSDTGPGFPEKEMTQLLDPFFTTKDDGTGLGLPIVNSILLGHNGSLALSNTAEGGAEVRVTLPAA